MSVLVPFAVWSGLAVDSGAVDCSMRESDRAYTGWVAELVFADERAHEFARRAATVLGRSVVVRRGPGMWVDSTWCIGECWLVSCPCQAPVRTAWQYLLLAG
jgi:hypothetical protein